MLTQNARRHGDRIGFVWGEKSWTWREIDAEVSALAAALAARGIGKGDRILVHSKNGEEMFWSMFAAFRLGAVWVPTNFRLMPDEVAYLATASGAKAFLCHGDFPDHARRSRVRSLAFVWRIGEEGTFGETYGARGDRGARRRRSRERRGRARRSLLVLLHLRHHRPLQGGGADPWPDGFCHHQPSRRPHAGAPRSSDASLVVAPLSHGAGVHQLMQTARGVKTILLPTEKFDIAEAFRLIETHRVSNLFTVPTILKMMVEHPAVDRFDHSSLRYVIYAGAPMYREDQKAALKKLGQVLVQYFGLGEVTGNITVLPTDAA